ncbi:MAG: hypothetical protein HY706_22070 [Candidatus Hydrogenedentes bacterium]|nr:hypothetical protein [Candidatus Hydrogenedentota bacterium]
MTTRERIHAEIENMPSEDLDALYTIIQGFLRRHQGANPAPLLSRLGNIVIEADQDFSVNHDRHIAGS